MKNISILLLALGLFWVLMPNFKVLADEQDPKVVICHATDSHTNPYVEEEVDGDSIINLPNGHNYHNGGVWYDGIADHSWGDIIPEFDYKVCPDGFEKNIPGGNCKQHVSGSTWNYSDYNIMHYEWQKLVTSWSGDLRE